MDFSTTDFLMPWWKLDAEQAEPLLREVLVEIPPGHELYGKSLVPIARSDRADDVLFKLDDGRFASIHLTWRRALEQLPWPMCHVYANLDDWVKQIMIPESEDE